MDAQRAACIAKRKHRSKIEALLAAVRKADAPALRAYRCPVCGHWHLTKHRAGSS